MAHWRLGTIVPDPQSFVAETVKNVEDLPRIKVSGCLEMGIEGGVMWITPTYIPPNIEIATDSDIE